MTARDTYVSSVATAEKTRVASSLANTVTYQTAIDAQQSVVGYGSYYSNNATLVSTSITANKQLLANRVAGSGGENGGA